MDVLSPVEAPGIEQLEVPELVQRGRLATEAYLHRAAAIVVIALGAVQWLVGVADEMHEEAQGIGTCLLRCTPVGEHAPQAQHGADDAAIAWGWAAISRRIVAGSLVGNVDEMPAARLR